MLALDKEHKEGLKNSSSGTNQYSDVIEEYSIFQENDEDEIVINIEGRMKLMSEDEYKEHISQLKYVNLNDDDDDDWDEYWDEEDDDEEE